MAVIEVTTDNVKEVLEQNKCVVMDFWATWCAPCRAIAPIFSLVASKNPDVVFAKVDVEKSPELIERFGVKSIPFICGVREQYVVMEIPGLMTEETLQKIVDYTRDVDLEELINEQD